jgi:hypothetical protein
MLTTIKHKLATIIRRKKKTPHPCVKDQAHTDRRISSSRSSDQDFGILHYSPRPWNAKNRPCRAVDFREEDDQISNLDLSGESHRFDSRSIGYPAANSTPSGNPQQQPESDTDSPATSETEIVGPIIVRYEGKYHQALLLTTEMSEAIQDIARIKKELHELDLEITKLTGQANELRLAKETLERREQSAIPGAFPSTADGGETARRQLLMPALRRRLEICEKSLHDLSGRRHLMGAELDVARQKIMGALEQV